MDEQSLKNLDPLLAERSSWQPIATAPKDGSGVLAYHPEWDCPHYIQWYESHRGGFHWFYYADKEWVDDDDPPTHWLPLPPFPKEEGQQTLVKRICSDPGKRGYPLIVYRNNENPS